MPSPQAIARRGHIATRLRALLDERGWKARDLARAVGLDTTKAERQRVHMWLGCYSAPDPAMRVKLARLCRCKAADLEPRDLNGTEKTALMVVPESQPNGQTPAPGRAVAPRRAKAGGGVAADPVIAYSVLPGGRAKLSVQIEGTEAQVFPYLQLMRAHQLPD